MIQWLRSLRASFEIDSDTGRGAPSMRTRIDRIHAALARSAGQPWQEPSAAMRPMILSGIVRHNGMPRELRPRRSWNLRPMAAAAGIAMVFGAGVWVGMGGGQFVGMMSQRLDSLTTAVSARLAARPATGPSVVAAAPTVTMFSTSTPEHEQGFEEARALRTDTAELAKVLLGSLPIDLVH